MKHVVRASFGGIGVSRTEDPIGRIFWTYVDRAATGCFPANPLCTGDLDPKLSHRPLTRAAQSENCTRRIDKVNNFN